MSRLMKPHAELADNPKAARAFKASEDAGNRGW